MIMRSKEYYKSLILSHAEEIKESIYIIFSPIFSAYLSYSVARQSFCPFYYICTWKNKEVRIFISANFC